MLSDPLADLYNSSQNVQSSHNCSTFLVRDISSHMEMFPTPKASTRLMKILLCPLYYYYQWHPVNFVLLGIFNLCINFAVGLTCAFTSGKVILESILTTVVVVSLTLYTFWAARRGHDFSFLEPFLLAGIMIIMVSALIQLFFPMGRITYMIYGAVAALIFCGYIMYDTDNLIKRYSYHEYIWAAVALYVDMIDLFLSLLTLFRAADA